MALQGVIIRSLHDAAKSGDGQVLKDAYSAITQNLSRQSTHRAGLEALIICAETALKLHNLDVAEKCLETYLLEVRRYGQDLSAVEVNDQFLCRAYYALGQLVSENSKQLKGKPLIDGTLESIKHVMKGLDIATSNPRYTFLVYNGSVKYWHVSRPLQRAAMRKYLLPSMERVMAVLDKVPGHEEWKVQNLMALALCQNEGGKPEETPKTLQRAYDMAVAAGPAVRKGVLLSVASLQVHLASEGGAGAGKGVKAAVAPKTPPAAAKKGGAAAGTAGVALDEEGAMRMIQAVLTGKPDLAAAEQQLREAVAKVDPNPEGSAKGANLMPVARAAWAAAVLGLPELAEKWSSRAAGSQELSPRVWSDMARILVGLKAVPAAAVQNVERSALHAHARVMEQLEDVVNTFSKLHDVEGIHEASRLIWNTGLPLLQPDWRRHVKRCFNSAARALEVISSPLHRLRVQLHLEAAKCDAAEDSLIKASQEVHKALALDYVASPEEQVRFQLERPLDRYLEPLHTALALRTSLTMEPANAEEEAVLLVERSKEARNPAIKRDLLTRAISKLDDLPHLQPPAADYTGADRSTLQLSCRRRCVIWAELIRSAAASKMEDIVRTAAPYCLDMVWSPGVEREMVMLQAQVSYLEAEACVAALKAQRCEVVPSLRQVVPSRTETGLRLPSSDAKQLQCLFLSAVLHGIRSGLSIKEPWVVVNGAALLWNTYLPIMHKHRYAELLTALEPAVDLLLQLGPGEADGSLICGMAEAYAKALEHHLLLNILVANAEADPDNDDVPPAVLNAAGQRCFRFNETLGYEVLPVARVKTASLDPRTHAAGAPIIAYMLPDACKRCEAALSRAGNAPSQSLYECYARLQQLRGAAVAIPSGTAPSSEQTSKVVGLIEGILRPDAAAKEQASLQADIRAAMAILSSLPLTNIELWAKLARAAAAVSSWPLALECAKAAVGALPEGQIASLKEPSDAPEISANVWFWLAIAEQVYGQAILALVSPTAQDQVTQLTLRHSALGHFVTAARLASFVKKGDLVETVAKLAWNACMPFMTKPLLRAALIGPLSVIVPLINSLGAVDTKFQVHLNALYIECLTAARKWADGLAATEEACKSIPNKREHRPLLTWRAVCLANIAASATAPNRSGSVGFGTRDVALSSANALNPEATKTLVNGEMFKVKEYIPEFQAHTWAVLSHHSVARYDQMSALQKGVQAVAKQPWVKTFYLAEYAEWLISSGINDSETCEDVLLTAADTIMEFDMGEEDGEDNGDDDDESFRRRGSLLGNEEFLAKRAADAKIDREKRKKRRKRLGINVGEATLDPNTPPSKLTATLLERFVRIFVMLSQVVLTADDLVDYLQTAHHYALRIITSAIIAAFTVPPSQALEMLQAGVQPPQRPNLPDTMAGWATFEFTDECWERLAADKSVLALSRESLPEAELTAAYIHLLIESLHKRGLDVHVLSLYQLLRMVARLAIKDEGMFQAATLGLVQAMDKLGMSREAGRLEKSLGCYWELTQGEKAESDRQRQVFDLIQAAAGRLGRARGGQHGVGRLSFLRDRDGSVTGTSRLGSPGPGAGGQLVPSLSTVGVSFGDMRRGGDPGPLPFDAQVPGWLEEAGKQMDGQGLDSGGLLAGVRELMVLHPWSLYDTWLVKGQHLMDRGHYAAARELLLHAQSHARHCSDQEAEAKALLCLSRCESMANNFEQAIRMLQVAQRVGGDFDFWQSSITTYVDCRLAAPHTTTSDAKEALMGGIAMFSAIARDDRAAEKAASSAVAALKLHLSKLLLHDMVTMRTQGVYNWKKHYDTAVTMCNQAIAGLAAREAGIPQIEAMLHQAKLLMEDPAPAKDIRPRLKKIEKVLVAAEEMATKFVQVAVPRDLSPGLSLPVSRLLGRARLALAELRLAQAMARDDNAAQDREYARPQFPKNNGEMAGGGGGGAAAGKGRKGKMAAAAAYAAAYPAGAGAGVEETVIIDFIDEMEDATPAFQPGLLPEDMALTLAESAAGMDHPFERAKGLLLAGQCLLYKYLTSAPEQEHPWPEKLKDKLSQLKRRRRKRFRQAQEAKAAAEKAAAAGGQAAGEGEGGAGDGGGSSGEGTDGGRARGSVDGAGDRTSIAGAGGVGGVEEEEDPPLDEEEQAALQQQLALARNLHAQCEDTLHQALQVTMRHQAWHDIETTALELARSHGRLRPSLTARYLCLASSAKVAVYLRDLLLTAAPLHQAEALCIKQAAIIQESLPAPEDSIHYQQVLDCLSMSAVSTSRISLGPDPSVAEAAVAAIPPGVRALLFYVSPDRATLYFAALNVPDEEATRAAAEAEAAAAAAAAGAKGGAAKAKERDGGAAPTLVTKCIVEAVPLDFAAMDALRNGLRGYRRGAEKKIRETVASAAAAGWGQAQQASRQRSAAGGERSGSPAKKGKGGGSRAGSGRGGGAKAGARRKAGGNSGSDGTATPAEERVEAIFPPALNASWGELVGSFESLLAPLMPVVRAALPEVTADGGDADGPAAAAATAAGGAKPPGAKKGSHEEAGGAGGKHSVLLLVDPELSALPFEALPYLRANCRAVSRCPSLHVLLALAQAAAASSSPDGGPAPAPSASASSPPTFDLGRLTYLVDPKCEGSSPEDTEGFPYSPPIIPTFQSTYLTEHKDWTGLVGQPNLVPSDAEILSLVSNASSLLFLGMGRFLSYVPPSVVGSVDLRGCDVAVLLGRVNNGKAHQRQLYLDNRKSQAERNLETPLRTAELLLLRGVKTVITTSMATTVAANMELLRVMFAALQGGANAAEAVWTALRACSSELEHARSNVLVYGLPHIVAGGGAGGKGGKGGAAKKK